MDWFFDEDEDELNEVEQRVVSMFGVRPSNKLYKNYSILQKAHLAQIDKTLFNIKLLPISHRRTNPILELTSFSGKKIIVNEGDLSRAKLTGTKVLTKDSDNNQIEIKAFALKNVLDNSAIV